MPSRKQKCAKSVFFQNTKARFNAALVLFTIGLLTVAAPAKAQITVLAQDRAFAAHYPPLVIENSPDSPGMAIEIVTTAAKRLDRDLSVEFFPFKRLLYSVSEHSNAMVPALFRTKEREESYTWVAQIYEQNMQFMTIGADSTIDALIAKYF